MQSGPYIMTKAKVFPGCFALDSSQLPKGNIPEWKRSMFGLFSAEPTPAHLCDVPRHLISKVMNDFITSSASTNVNTDYNKPDELNVRSFRLSLKKQSSYWLFIRHTPKIEQWRKNKAMGWENKNIQNAKMWMTITESKQKASYFTLLTRSPHKTARTSITAWATSYINWMHKLISLKFQILKLVMWVLVYLWDWWNETTVALSIVNGGSAETCETWGWLHLP